MEAIDRAADGIPPVRVWLGARINNQAPLDMVRVMDASMALLPLRLAESWDIVVAFKEEEEFITWRKAIQRDNMPQIFFLDNRWERLAEKSLTERFVCSQKARALIKSIHDAGRRAVLIPSQPVRDLDVFCDTTGACFFGGDFSMTLVLSKRDIYYDIMKHAGLTIPDGFWCEGVRDADRATRMLRKQFPEDDIFLKSVLGSGGSGIIRLSKGQEVPPEFFERHRKLRIERVVPFKGSVNLQYLIEKEQEPFLLIASLQKLTDTDAGGFRYYGNLFPPWVGVPKKELSAMEKTVSRAAILLQQYGFRGIVGFDCVWDAYGNIFFTDMNPRWNASSYLVADFHRTPKGTYRCTAFLNSRPGRCASLQQILKKFQVFCRKNKSREGVLDILTACLRNTRAGPVLSTTILIQAETPARLEAIETECKQAIEV